MSDTIRVENLKTGLSLVTMNRAERRNALCIEMLEALYHAVNDIESNSANRVMILRGAGTVFSAGLDLKEASDSSLVEHSAAWVKRALKLMRETSLITIAAVPSGGAFAGGAGLMAACDFAVAAESSKIGFPEARRGLLPALICGVLKTKIREGDLRELFLVGNAISAERALRIGLVQHIVPDDQVLDMAISLADSILEGGPQTIRLTKKLLNETFPPSDHDEALVQIHLEARYSSEAREGLSAFLEKRPPFWMASAQKTKEKT